MVCVTQPRFVASCVDTHLALIGRETGSHSRTPTPQRQHSDEQDGGSLTKSSERREATDIRDRSVGPAVAAIGTRGISGLFGVLTDESRQFAWSPTPLTERPPIR